MSEFDEVKDPASDAKSSDLAAEIDALRLAIERERQALRGTPQQHATQLTDQAAALGETFATLSSLALGGFERAEQRLAALEQDLRGRMTQLSRDMQAVVAELRSARSPSGPGPAAAFPLETVMRIHEELRESDDTPVSSADALNAGLSAFSRPAAPPPPALPESTAQTTALVARVESLERALSDAAETRQSPPAQQAPAATVANYSIIGLAAVVALVVLGGFLVYQRIEARLSEATVRMTEAERQRDALAAAADSRLAAARQEAAKQVAEARQAATQAEVVSNVLASPDLVRYWLLGGKANPRSYGRVMFSRSRGMVFSATRLPPVTAGQTYHLWLLSRGGPIGAGAITPDRAGRVTFATDSPVSVPRRLTGALLTMEPTSNPQRPGKTPVLVQVP